MSTRNKIKGFTLVEMAIVVIIFGLGLASFSHVVDLYRKTTAINETTTSIAEITDYIGAFRELYGRYPCPASMTDTRDEANYGREDCSDMTAIAPGNCTADNGICIEQSTRSYDFEDPYTGATGVRPSRTRVGFIPFRQLNLAEDQAYDGYDHRIAYVVTEHLTDSDTFQPGGGGIDIIDDTGGSALEAAATAHFLIFSHGENGEGAYTLDGNRSPCAATAAEAQNCDLSANAIYSLLQTGTSGEADNYDDVMSFFTQKDLPLWQMSDATGQEDHAHVKNPGKVGFGVDDESAVSEELQIGNALRVVDDPQTTPVEGKIKAQNICDYNGTTGNCFAPSKIAGEIVQGEGMPCPSGTYREQRAYMRARSRRQMSNRPLHERSGF